MERSIAHINIAWFQTSVAVMAAGKRSLLEYPLAVVNSSSDNALLVDISSQSSVFGLKRGMKLIEAKRLCPELKLLSPSLGAYKEAEKVIISELSHFSPSVETAGAGHFFADMSGTIRINGSELNFANKIKSNIEDSLGLKSTVGIGSNKLISKVATKILRPSGICTVEHGEERIFMSPLPIADLPGIDKRTIKVLGQLNIINIKQLQNISLKLLSSVIDNAEKVVSLAKGIDNSPIYNYLQPSPSIEEYCRLEEPTNDDISILYEIKILLSKACLRLRNSGLAVVKMKLFFEYTDGGFQKRSKKFKIPIMGELTLFEILKELYKSLPKRRIRISFINITFDELSFPYGQADLFQDTEKEEKLFKALDLLKSRFGNNIINFNGLPSPIQ